MIVKSLIENDMKVALDCAKATLVKGGKIKIADELYDHAEIQGAIKAGYAEIEGEPPQCSKAKVEEKKKKLKNIDPKKRKIAIECIKGTVEYGEFIEVPESAMNTKEIQNAIAWGMLEDPEAPPKIADVGQSKPLVIDEAKVSPSGGKKFKPLSKVSGGVEEATEEAEDVSLYKESKVIDPSASQLEDLISPTKKKSTKKKTSTKKTEEKRTPDRFDFLDIFGEE